MRLVAFIVALAISPAVAEPLNIKGLEPGMTREQVAAAHPGLDAHCGEWKREPFGLHCTYSPSARSRQIAVPTLDSIAGAPVVLWLVSFQGPEVARVLANLDTKHFARVVAAITEKYGEPAKRSTGTVQNRMGATFDQHEITWSRDGRVLTVTRRASKLSEMRVFLTSEDKLRELDDTLKNRTKSDAGDL